jgi:hypothetical protein
MLTPRENFIRFLKNEEYEWTPTSSDQLQFRPTMILDHIARAMVVQQNPYTGAYGGKDLFGIDWVFEPSVGGSMEVAPLFDDIEEWEDHVVFPDVDALDWEGCAKENEEYLKTDKVIFTTIYTGFFERLISFVGFENAAMALIDEDQKEDVHKIFQGLTDVYIKLIRHMHRWFNVELMEFHDDWGTQRDTMFSAATLQEMILPYLKQIVDAAHEEGVFIELHSCGKIDSFIPYVIEAGVDTWRGQANVIDKMGLVQRYGDRFKFCVEIRPAAPMPKDELLAFADEIIGQCRGKRVWLGLARLLAGEMRDALYAHVKEIGVI